MTTPPTSSVQSDFARAFEHHRAGRLAEATALYRKVVASDPRHLDALHLLGMITAQAGDPLEGERMIAAASSIKDDVPLIWNNHGNVLGMLGRREAAIASFDRALALKPDFDEARYNRAGHQIACGLAEQALADLSQALSGAPGNHVLVTGCGNALMALERYDEAIAAYDRAIAS